MSIFDPGQSKTTATTQPSSASAAMKLFIIQLLMSRLQQTGGAPQTFGNYVNQGPRKLDTSQIAGGLPELMDALKQPGAFDSRQVNKTQPSSPSLFQDLAALIPLGALGYQVYKGQQPNTGDMLNKLIMAKMLGMDPKTLGIDAGALGGQPAASAAVTPTFGDTPQAADLFTNDLFTDAINSSGGNAMDFGATY